MILDLKILCFAVITFNFCNNSIEFWLKSPIFICKLNMTFFSDLDINWRSHEGKTALYVACRKQTHKDQLKIIKLLIEKGANLEIPTNENVTTLHAG